MKAILIISGCLFIVLMIIGIIVFRICKLGMKELEEQMKSEYEDTMEFAKNCPDETLLNDMFGNDRDFDKPYKKL